MSTLVWEIYKRHGWAVIRTTPDKLSFNVCHIRRVENGLWLGEYINQHTPACVELPGEYPLEELKAILETTIALLEAQ